MNIEYSSQYFEYQRVVGFFGGEANIFKFKYFIDKADTVLDYGCGGGYLLANVDAAKKLGVELNPVAKEVAASNGVTVFGAIEDVPDQSVDVIISNHTLEHVERPLDSLMELRGKLKSRDSKAVFVVPHEGVSGKYWTGDPNQHLYTWNPLTLGNLFVAAGFREPRIELIRHKWPRGYLKIQRSFGWSVFHAISKMYARFKKDYQLRIVVSRGDL